MPTPAATHDHAISIDLALEFLDTLEYQRGRPVELLPTTSDAIDWLEEHGLIHDPCEPELDAARASLKIRKSPTSFFSPRCPTPNNRTSVAATSRTS